MSDLYLTQNQLDHPGHIEPPHTLGQIEQARYLFQRSYLKGKLAALKARLTGQSSQMRELAAVTGTSRVSARHAGGLQTVSIQQIQGSEGRTRDFDCHFNPIRTHIQERWMNLAMAMMVELPLPAVQLVQVGEYYYVQDGHHRISVAQALGYAYIDAEVTIWEMEPQPGPAAQPSSSIDNAEKNQDLTSDLCFPVAR
jgi:hypothetical protein